MGNVHVPKSSKSALFDAMYLEEGLAEAAVDIMCGGSWGWLGRAED